MTNEARVGLFVFIVIVIFVVLSIKIGELSFNNKTTYPMSMVFSSVEGLKPGSNLELAGVVVGKVTRIQLNKDYSATVTADVYEDIMLPIDSTAAISTKGVLGDKIITLSPGTANSFIKPNGNLARTEMPPSLDYLMTQMGEIATNLADLTSSLNTALGGEEGLSNLRGIMENLNTLTFDLRSIVADNRDQIDTTIANIDTASGNLALLSGNLNQASQGINRIVGDVQAGQGTLGKLVTDDQLYTALTETVAKLQMITNNMVEDNSIALLLSDNTLYYDLLAVSDNLKLVSEQVAAGEGTLGRLVNDDELYRSLTEAARSANKAAQGIEEQTPITVMGTILGLIW
jgi:phospholipid/cholesterol/gamma-HCH transport system substrate-binding protein